MSEPYEFAQSVLDKIGGIEGLQEKSVGEPATPEPVEGGLAEPQPPPQRPRGDDGRFVAAEQEPSEPPGDEPEPQPEPEGEPEEEPYVLEVDDPAVASYLEKYGNDLGKALKAATEAQSLIGRQGGEVGDLRQQLSDLQQMVAQQQYQQQQPQALPPGYFDQMMESDPRGAAQAAYQYGDYDAMAKAVELWKDPEYGDDPFGAAVFITSIQNNLAMQQMQQQLYAAQFYANGADPSQQTLEGEVQRVMEKHPDIEQYIPTIQTLANENPVFLQALQYGSPQERAATLESLTQLAKSRTGSATSSDAMARVQVRIRAENDEAKRKAAVVSAGRRGTQPSESDRVTEWKRAFRAKTGLPDLEVS